VNPSELDQLFDAEVGEHLDAFFSDAIDPDDAVLDVLVEVRGHTGDGGDVMNRSDAQRKSDSAQALTAGCPNNPVSVRPTPDAYGAS
jgi:hypothetical protein